MCQRLNTGESNNFYFCIFICIWPLNLSILILIIFAELLLIVLQLHAILMVCYSVSRGTCSWCTSCTSSTAYAALPLVPSVINMTNKSRLRIEPCGIPTWLLLPRTSPDNLAVTQSVAFRLLIDYEAIILDYCSSVLSNLV